MLNRRHLQKLTPFLIDKYAEQTTNKFEVSLPMCFPKSHPHKSHFFIKSVTKNRGPMPVKYIEATG